MQPRKGADAVLTLLATCALLATARLAAAESFDLRNPVALRSCSHSVTGSFGTISLGGGSCAYRFYAVPDVTSPRTEFWYLTVSGAVNRSSLSLSETRAYDGSLNQLVPQVFPNELLHVIVPITNPPDAVYMGLNTFNASTITVTASAVTQCGIGYVQLRLYHQFLDLELDKKPFYSVCLLSPEPDVGDDDSISMTLTAALDYADLPPSCSQYGFVAEVTFDAHPRLLGKRMSVTFAPDPATATAMLFEVTDGDAYLALTEDGDVIIPWGQPTLAVLYEVAPRNVASPSAMLLNEVSIFTSDNSTYRLHTASDLGDEEDAYAEAPDASPSPTPTPRPTSSVSLPNGTLTSYIVDLEEECRPFSSPRILDASFFQATYYNTRAQTCAFFIPLTLADGSAVLAYNLQAFDLDGSTTISVYHENLTASQPLLTLTNATRLQLPASQFTAHGGILITISASGTGRPFDLLVSTTASCRAGRLPVGLINGLDFGSSSTTDDAPLTFCVDAGRTVVAGGALEFNTTFELPVTELPHYRNSTYVVVLHPDASSLVPGACYTVTATTPWPATTFALPALGAAIALAPGSIVCVPQDGFKDLQVRQSFNSRDLVMQSARNFISARLALAPGGPSASPAYPPTYPPVYPPASSPPDRVPSVPPVERAVLGSGQLPAASLCHLLSFLLGASILLALL